MLRKTIIYRLALIAILVGGIFSYIYLARQPLQEEGVVRCSDKQDPEECWNELLLLTLTQNGIEKVFDRIADLYDEDPRFSTACHYLTHNVGIAAYQQFLQDKESILTPKAAYCANGFYHGLMEAFLTATGDFKEAREFCAYIDRKLAVQAPDAALQCFHGIGHGAMDLAMIDGIKEKDERLLINPSLRICEEVSDTSEQLYRCASGVFNGIANFYIEGKLGFTVREEDPLWVCREQPEKYKESCYGNMNSSIFWLTEKNFLKSAKFIEKIEENEYAIPAMRYLAGMSTLYFVKNNYAEAINACRVLQKRLQSSCIEGFVQGFLEHGTPGVEYNEALNFCRAKTLTVQEREACFQYTLAGLNKWYSLNKVKEICNDVEKRYKKYCLIK